MPKILGLQRSSQVEMGAEGESGCCCIVRGFRKFQLSFIQISTQIISTVHINL